MQPFFGRRAVGRAGDRSGGGKSLTSSCVRHVSIARFSSGTGEIRLAAVSQ
jgi:hypothetical protein